MDGSAPRSARPEKADVLNSQPPNMPEVSGTSFPVVTTVLAGFAVTIAVQLIIRPEPTETLSGLLTGAIIVFLASTLLFIVSIVFAVNAQAHNYLPFIDIGTTGRQLLEVDDMRSWIEWLQRRWNAFHMASVITFYSAILLLLAGVHLIVWEFIGSGVALVYVAIVMSSLVCTLAVTIYVDRLKPERLPAAGPPGSPVVEGDTEIQDTQQVKVAHKMAGERSQPEPSS